MGEDEKYCNERHTRVNERLGTNENRLNNYGSRIDLLEQFRSGTETQMANLVEQIKSLVSTIQWMMTFTIVTLVGFMLWYIQNIGR